MARYNELERGFRVLFTLLALFTPRWSRGGPEAARREPAFGEPAFGELVEGSLAKGADKSCQEYF